MKMDLPSLETDIRNNQIVLIVLPKEKYFEYLTQIVKVLDLTSQKICYACLNKPYMSIEMMLKNNDINTQKYFFIDVLTSAVQTPELTDNCEFVQSPSALTDLSLAFTKATHEKGCENVFFDTISTLMIYEGIGEIIKFTQNLMTKARVTGVKSVYLALKEDSEELIKDLMMFVDKVVNLE